MTTNIENIIRERLATFKFAPVEACQRWQIFPNMVAYSEEHATMVQVVKRSNQGDFALGENGLNYLRSVFETGRKDGKPVRTALYLSSLLRQIHTRSFAFGRLRRCSNVLKVGRLEMASTV